MQESDEEFCPTLQENNFCDICGKPALKFEPRFLYWTCSEHENIAPVHRYDYKLEYRLGDHNANQR